MLKTTWEDQKGPGLIQPSMATNGSQMQCPIYNAKSTSKNTYASKSNTNNLDIKPWALYPFYEDSASLTRRLKDCATLLKR